MSENGTRRVSGVECTVWKTTDLVGHLKDFSAGLRDRPAVVIGLDGVSPRAIALSLEEFDRLTRTSMASAALWWETYTDIADILGLTYEEELQVTGLDEEMLEECQEYGGVNPMSITGQRILILVEMYRALAFAGGGMHARNWIRQPNAELGAVPATMFEDFDQFRRVRDEAVRLSGRKGVGTGGFEVHAGYDAPG